MAHKWYIQLTFSITLMPQAYEDTHILIRGSGASELYSERASIKIPDVVNNNLADNDKK